MIREVPTISGHSFDMRDKEAVSGKVPCLNCGWTGDALAAEAVQGKDMICADMLAEWPKRQWDVGGFRRFLSEEEATAAAERVVPHNGVWYVGSGAFMTDNVIRIPQRRGAEMGVSRPPTIPKSH